MHLLFNNVYLVSIHTYKIFSNYKQQRITVLLLVFSIYLKDSFGSVEKWVGTMICRWFVKVWKLCKLHNSSFSEVFSPSGIRLTEAKSRVVSSSLPPIKLMPRAWASLANGDK